MLPTVQVPREALIKVADVLDGLARELTALEQDNARLRKEAERRPSPQIELLKVASADVKAAFVRALHRGGLEKAAAQRAADLYLESPDALVKFATQLLDQTFSHMPADGRGFPRTGSETPSSEGQRKLAYD